MNFVLETDPAGLGTLFRLSGGRTEARQERVARLERLGVMDPDCPSSYCKDRYDAEDPANVFAPVHRADPRCRSGGHPHCTCPTCWG